MNNNTTWTTTGVVFWAVIAVIVAYTLGQTNGSNTSTQPTSVSTTSASTIPIHSTTSSSTVPVQASTVPFLNASGNLTSAFIARIEPNVVEINCYSYDGSIESSGSGISLVRVKTKVNVIYTNYHIYAGAIVNDVAPSCYAVFPQAPNFTFNGSYGDYQLALTSYLYKPGNSVDAALFTIGAPLPSTAALNSLPTMEDAYKAYGIKDGMCNANTQVSVGDSVTLFGYPNSGNLLGTSETVTAGIVSGILPGPIYKTDAPIDHGNSGGYAVLNKDGCGLGIPTLGESGLTAGIGYIQSYALVAAQ